MASRALRARQAVLLHLDRFLVAQRPAPSALTPDRFAAWSITLAYLTPTVRRNRMRIVRNLCQYLRRTDPCASRKLCRVENSAVARHRGRAVEGDA